MKPCKKMTEKCERSTKYNEQRTTHNAQRTTHNAQRTTHNEQRRTNNAQRTSSKEIHKQYAIKANNQTGKPTWGKLQAKRNHHGNIRLIRTTDSQRTCEINREKRNENKDSNKKTKTKHDTTNNKETNKCNDKRTPTNTVAFTVDETERPERTTVKGSTMKSSQHTHKQAEVRESQKVRQARPNAKNTVTKQQGTMKLRNEHGQRGQTINHTFTPQNTSTLTHEDIQAGGTLTNEDIQAERGHQQLSEQRQSTCTRRERTNNK